MKYKIYYMNFITPLHVGTGLLSESDYVISADTLFSALCIEALKSGGEGEIEKLVSAVKCGKLLLSDAMPYIQDELWIRKPFINIRAEVDGDSKLKKSFKNMTFIPMAKVNEYIDGKIDPVEIKTKFNSLGKADTIIRSALRDDESMPYTVGTYSFKQGNGLYVIIGTTDETVATFVEALFTGLGYTGIGGKISSGLGKYRVDVLDLPCALSTKFNNKCERNITLSISLPTEQELEEVLLGAKYKLIKRSGFIQSAKYSDSLRKRKDLYVFQSGAFVQKKIQR